MTEKLLSQGELLNQLKQEYANSDYSDTARGIYNQAVEDVRVEGKKNAIKQINWLQTILSNEHRFAQIAWIKYHWDLKESDIRG